MSAEGMSILLSSLLLVLSVEEDIVVLNSIILLVPQI